MTDDLFGRVPRNRPGRVRRDTDSDARAARADGRTPPAGLLAALRSLADTIDAAAASIDARRRVGAEPPTGLVMAQTQATHEYAAVYALVMPGGDRDPIDTLLDEFAAAAASRDAP